MRSGCISGNMVRRVDRPRIVRFIVKAPEILMRAPAKRCTYIGYIGAVEMCKGVRFDLEKNERLGRCASLSSGPSAKRLASPSIRGAGSGATLAG